MLETTQNIFLKKDSRELAYQANNMNTRSVSANDMFVQFNGKEERKYNKDKQGREDRES